MTAAGSAQPPQANRRNSTATVAVIGVVVLAGLATILIVTLLNRGPTDEAAGSAPPTPSAIPSGSGSATSTASPSASATEAGEASPSATATPAAGLPDGLLPAGSMITVTGDGVRIRSEPSTDADIVAAMAAGDLAHVIDSIAAGPVASGGYEWYQVAYREGDDVWPWQDFGPDGIVYGWVAAGNDDERFVTLADVSCPSEPITLSDLAIELTGWERLVCIEDTVTIEGTFGCDGCTDRMTPGASPTWLADVEQQPPIAGAYEYYPFTVIAVQPEMTPPENRDIVRATLRIDHPAASGCTYTPDPNRPTGQLTHDPVAIQVFCRERLVLESFEVIGTDDSGR